MSRPAIDDALLYSGISDLASSIRDRRLSPVALTEAYLERARRLGPKLNAFATFMEDTALEQARNAESEIASGRYRGPLHGVPYGAKDLLATRGVVTTWGAEPYKDQVFDYDAAVIERLRDAGAVLLGKLGMVELAGGLDYSYADASFTGPGLNPWDPSRWSGGSSSGPGSSVPSALVGFAIGSETWGSILCPAAFCGCTGLRPTYGLVPRHGAMALGYTFDKLGPMARSVLDCELILESISGPDDRDPTSTGPVHRAAAISAEEARKFRLGLLPAEFDMHGQPEAKRAFERAVSDLRGTGVRIEEAQLPDFPFREVAGVILLAEAAAAFEELWRNGRVRELRTPEAPQQFVIARALEGPDLMKAQRMRSYLQEELNRYLSNYDVIVAANFLTIAPRIEENLYDALPGSDPLGAAGNLCGIPALALPSGFGSEGMPVGFQFTGAAFSEAKLCALGRLYQSVTDWHRRRPPI